jgi:hypothetical protein
VAVGATVVIDEHEAGKRMQGSSDANARSQLHTAKESTLMDLQGDYGIAMLKFD